MTTRLVLKLKEVYDEFSATAGFAPDLTELETIAGTDTALAVYDIGKLDLVYISKMPAAQLGQNVLIRVRGGYDTHSSGTQSYFVKQSGNRAAAFAIVGDYVVAATREDLLVEALGLIQGNTAARSVNQELWFDAAVRAMGADGGRPIALRLVMDLPNVMKTPYFRSYWIQNNAEDLRAYSSFMSQVVRNADAFEESRVLIRSEEAPLVAHEAATAELQRFIPENIGLFRLWDTSSVDFAMDLIREKFFASGTLGPVARNSAPVLSGEGPVGWEGDLQTRIDEAPKPSLAGTLALEPLKALLASEGLEAVLHLESSVPAEDTTFVRSDAAVAFRGSQAWNADRVRAALTSAVESYQSVSALGLQWRNVTSGGLTLSQWDGLIPLTVYVDGQTLWISRTPSLLTSALSRRTSTPQPGIYLARYDHRGELNSYLKMMRMLDLSDQSNYSDFFSENIGSLASSLDTIRSVSIRTTESPLIQRQAVRYEIAR
jgi:hypothetical protein